LGVLRAAVSIVLFLLGACASPLERARALAAPRAMAAAAVDGGPFTLMTFAPRAFVAGQPLTVYVEGDGYAFIHADRLSDDPTPRRPTALELAVRDPSPNVVYVARPCQYVEGAARRNCHPLYWSIGRFAEPVIDATARVIDHYRTASGAAAVRLVGYSGGGAVVALLAARRPDLVERLVTVAGVLDAAAWAGLDGSTPLSASLDPADFVSRLTGIRQTHFVGAEDKVVPEAVARAFAARFPAGAQPRVLVVHGQEHICCWAEKWFELLKRLD
jgi:hypothetical protein